MVSRYNKHGSEEPVRKYRRVLLLLFISVLLLVSLPAFAAAHGVEKHEGASPTDTIGDLIFELLVFAAIVGIFVYVVLFAALWMFRKSSKRKRRFDYTENRRLEIAWIIVPSIIVTYLAYISGQALIVLDDPPDEGMRIDVIGHQWLWEFRYPDGNMSINTLYIREHETVIFDVTSADVIHALFIPDFNVKIDALPGKNNKIWFVAETAGEYNILCAEFCGNEHHAMVGKLIIYPEEEGRGAFGPPPILSQGPGGEPVSGRVIDVELRESGGTDPGRPWSIFPAEIELDEGETVSLRVMNKGNSVHNYTIGSPYDLEIMSIAPDEFEWLNFTASRATSGTSYWCAVPGHKEVGMEGSLVVGEHEDTDIDENDEPDRQFQIIVFSSVFLLFFIVIMIAFKRGWSKDNGSEGSDDDETVPDDDGKQSGEGDNQSG